MQLLHELKEFLTLVTSPTTSLLPSRLSKTMSLNPLRTLRFMAVVM